MAVPKFWRQIPALYNLEGSVCGCGALAFPPREVCPKCHAVGLKPHRFRGKGTVETFTIIRTPTTDPEGENIEVPARSIPYVMGIIRLEEGPRLTAQIVDARPEDVRIGDRVELVFRKLLEKGPKGVIQYGYKFRPV
ncbi:MAG: Zn-ribbon domain-containing OB-fold protein [DPANN group archaeon]|nr:Zn-ribbon domain-containing OB-fold protein [DPANN group archaeon]